MVKHECAQCKKAKARIVSILKTDPDYSFVKTDDDSKKPDFPNEKISEFLPERDFWPDVYATKTIVTYETYIPPGIKDASGRQIKKIQLYRHQSIIIEVDHIQKGSSSHRSKTSTQKDRERDKHFISKRIPTVRFDLKNLVGKKIWNDDEIFDTIDKEIEYQLK